MSKMFFCMKLIFVFLLFVFSSVNAMQSKQEIINHCIKQMALIDGGNFMVLNCIKLELKSQKELQELMNDNAG